MALFKETKRNLGYENDNSWKILVVDDEPDVHAITSVVAKTIKYTGKGVLLISAYSSEEAKKILTNTNDIAIAIVDIVMEKEVSGFELVKFIREEMGNDTIRIVVRTGQPGYAPPREVILKYDINDYREKSELTSNALYTMIIGRLREYETIVELKKQRELLRRTNEILGETLKKTEFEEKVENLIKGLQVFSSLINPSCTIEFETEIEKSNKNRNWVELHSTNNVYSLVLTYPDLDRRYLIRASFHDHLKKDYQDIVDIFFKQFSLLFQNHALLNEQISILEKIIYFISETVETRSLETGEHVKRVGNISLALAKELEIEEDKLSYFSLAAMLHDIGKIGIPDSILNKPGKLSDEEFEIMKTHTTLGHKILSVVDHPFFELASTIAFYHHENWNGSGYPKGLKGEEIPIEARIVAIADVYDALTSNRVYRPAWSERDALDFIQKQKGIKFDPKIVGIFFENYEKIIRSSLK